MGIVLLGIGWACGGNRASGPETPEERFARLGRQVYQTYCATCHQPNGQGVPEAYPPLSQTEWVLGDKGRLIRLLLHGMQGPVEVKGERYDNVMPPHRILTDDQIAAVLSHVRSHFGNEAEAVSPDEVSAVRRTTSRERLLDAEVLRQQTGIPSD